MKKITILAIFCFYLSSISAQCYMDRHNTTWYDGWASCEEAINPNADRGMGHWILYNFGKVYQLNESIIWNTNEPAHLNWGINQAMIDYSIDGINWQEWGLWNFEMGNGENIYEGFSGPDFEGLEAQYILITALSNFGGECYGLSEVRFGANELTTSLDDLNPSDKWCLSAQVYPNPFMYEATLDVVTNCAGDLMYTVTDALGRIVVKEQILGNGTYRQSYKLRLDNLMPGMYFINLRQNNNRRQLKLMKLADR